MLHLNARIEFEKRILARVAVVHVLHGAKATVPDGLREGDGAPLHFLHLRGVDAHDGAFLDDFLMSTLHRAISGANGNARAVGVGE